MSCDRELSRGATVARVIVLVFVALVSTASTCAGEEMSPLQRTVADVRNVGVATMSWLTDQVAGSGEATAEGDEPIVIEVGSYAPISADELEELLVPDYLESLPRDDGWGHPYEYRLNRQDLAGERVILIRSPGSDGGFDGDRYPAEGFPPAETEHDVVWTDGYFVRWPAAGTSR